MGSAFVLKLHHSHERCNSKFISIIYLLRLIDDFHKPLFDDLNNVYLFPTF